MQKLNSSVFEALVSVSRESFEKTNAPKLRLSEALKNQTSCNLEHEPVHASSFQTRFLYLNVFHLLASLYENRLSISCSSQELHFVDSPWNGFEQLLIALAATVSLLALSIIISNLPDEIAALCRVDITTSLIAILKPSLHFSSNPQPPRLLSLAWRPILIEMKPFVMFAAKPGCCMWNVVSTNWPPKMFVPLLSFLPLPLTVADEINLTPRPETNTGKDWCIEA